MARIHEKVCWKSWHQTKLVALINLNGGVAMKDSKYTRSCEQNGITGLNLCREAGDVKWSTFLWPVVGILSYSKHIKYHIINDVWVWCWWSAERLRCGEQSTATPRLVDLPKASSKAEISLGIVYILEIGADVELVSFHHIFWDPLAGYSQGCSNKELPRISGWKSQTRLEPA